MTTPHDLDGGTPGGVPPSDDGAFRYWRAKIAWALVALLSAAGLGALVSPSPAAQALASDISGGSFAQPYSPATYDGASRSSALPTATPQASTPRPTPAVPVCPVPTYTQRRGVPAHSPIRIQIPSLGIDAAIELAGVDKHKNMQVPVNPCDVAWYKLGPVPGAAGDAVIDGHLDWTGPAVFWKLDNIRRGAEIDIIDADGVRLRFKVTTLTFAPHLTPPAGLFTTTGPATLTLYTCAGVWEPSAQTYSKRLFVTAVPMSRG